VNFKCVRILYKTPYRAERTTAWRINLILLRYSAATTKVTAHYLQQNEATSRHNTTTETVYLHNQLSPPEHKTSQQKDITHLKEKDKEGN